MRLIIVGAGISGLSLAYFLLEKKPSLEIVILESEKKPGGKIWTDRADGFLCEGGVNGFLDNKPRTLELVSRLSLSPLRSSDNARKRFIFSEGKLQRLPESPVSFFASGLLSLPGRVRIAMEAIVPKGGGEEETLADFARRRLGKEAYEKLIDPMASGIYAGDPEKMSLKSCFPRIYELEQNYGSLIRAMLSLQKEARKTGRKVGAGPGGVLTSFMGGMETLIAALSAALGTRLRTAAKAVGVEKKGKGYTVHLSDGTSEEGELAVIASPAFETSAMVKDLDKELSRALAGIYYPSISVVCLGYRREKIKISLDGFGFLIPSGEGRRLLGTLWDSSIFPDRAKEGYVLLRSMLGGVRRSELAEMEEKKQVSVVMEELSTIMGVDAEPDFSRVYIHRKGIPQYFPGHSKILEMTDSVPRRFEGLYLTGNAYRGIGVNDCIEASYRLAEKIAQTI
jgi:protoporphyrinogen/coproporphyrinogen III oxidase